jgi:endonuclease YncB( thermonuclease family)
MQSLRLSLFRLSAIACFSCPLSPASALADDLVGRATVVDGDTIEIHGVHIRYGASTLPKVISFAATTRAISIPAADRPQPL